jgi:hypothetical protein
MHPIAALMLSGAIEEERRRGARLRRRWPDSQDDLAAEKLIGRGRPARDWSHLGPHAPKR